MTPEQTLKAMTKQLTSMKSLVKKEVAVGVLASKATGRIYKSGSTVIQVAASHEYNDRSFLRMPQELKKKELDSFINKQMIKVLGGDITVEKGLGLVGIFAVNISQDAFDSGGFGMWPDIKEETKKRKGSSAILIDKGILRNSVSWEVR